MTHGLSPFMSILHGFAEACAQQWAEREVHHDPSGEIPVGDGWIKVETDPSGYSTWERRKSPTSEALADIREWQRSRS